jgi:hypothetical protein
MMKPPVAGMHGRHRILGTPGPTGWNDHGDPCRASQSGPTPGSLGVNDHGSPLPGPAALLASERRQDTEAHINRIVEEANSTAHPRTEQKLQACLDAVKTRGSADYVQDEAARCAEAYFDARLHALQRKSVVTGESLEQAPRRNALHIGGVEYRAPGTFFQPLGSHRASGTPLGLSYERIGQALPGRDAELAARDSTADWIEKGTADGLRDRSDVSGKLRRYASIV